MKNKSTGLKIDTKSLEFIAKGHKYRLSHVNLIMTDLTEQDEFIMGANLWPILKENISNLKLILFGLPASFYCWIEASSILKVAFITPYDSLSNSIYELTTFW